MFRWHICYLHMQHIAAIPMIIYSDRKMYYNVTFASTFGYNTLWFPLSANSLSVTSQMLCPLATTTCGGHWLQIASLWPLKCYVPRPQQSPADRPPLYKTNCVTKTLLQSTPIKAQRPEAPHPATHTDAIIYEMKQRGYTSWGLRPPQFTAAGRPRS